MDRHRVLTWNVHGAYLEALARTGLELYLPITGDSRPGYGGRARLDLRDAVREVPIDDVRRLRLDAVLYQAATHYRFDREWLLSDEQRRLPAIYLEHDPPREAPTETRHLVADDPNVLLVHVTAFNALMWDSGSAPVRVIEHGVEVPGHARYSGDLPRGVTAINNLASRGRRLGADVFDGWQAQVPLDLFGMDAARWGGREVGRDQLAGELARRRFFAYPVRYTSLGMALVEAMMVGLPIVALATTEIPTVIENGVSGFIDTDPSRLVEPMHRLLADRGLAAAMGAEARRGALDRFGIGRFAADWRDAAAQVAGRPRRAIAGPLAAGVAW